MLHGGERFAVREVSWNEKKCEIANLRANNYGGQNDVSLLEFFDDDVLMLGGVNMVFESQPLVFAPQDERDQLPEMERQEGFAFGGIELGAELDSVLDDGLPDAIGSHRTKEEKCPKCGFQWLKQ